MASVSTAGDGGEGGEGGKEDRSGLSTIIDAARRGGQESLDRLLKVAYVYCRLVAIQQTPKRLSAKFDPSDVGMVSVVDVARDIRSFQGRSREFLGWLRQIVHHNAIDLQRRHARSAENECLDDRVWDDLKWEEIGRKLNRSADASRQLFARALDAVRSDLRGESLGAGRGV